MGVFYMEPGSFLLLESSESSVRVSWSIIISIVSLVTLLAVFVVRKAVKAHRMKPVSGREGMLGEKGIADSAINTDGRVFVRGEYWDAWSDETIEQGERIVVIDVDGMMLKVKKGSIMQNFRR
jgi:membrane-bound serine protease (ClpP class)